MYTVPAKSKYTVCYDNYGVSDATMISTGDIVLVAVTVTGLVRVETDVMTILLVKVSYTESRRGGYSNQGDLRND